KARPTRRRLARRGDRRASARRVRLTAKRLSCYLTHHPEFASLLFPCAFVVNREDRMNLFLHGLARSVAETFALPGPILEIGSNHSEDAANIADLRSFFPGREYIGIDIRPGPGVDRTADVENLPYPDA